MLQVDPQRFGARGPVPRWMSRWGARLSPANPDPSRPPGAAEAGQAGTKRGIFRSMYVSAENRLEKQPALVKLAVTFGGASVILKQLTIKEHS